MVLGEYDRRTTETSENEIAVKRYIRHSRFNKPYPINNDIALLELVAPTKITSLINTVCLPSQDYALPPITSKCYITGEKKGMVLNDWLKRHPFQWYQSPEGAGGGGGSISIPSLNFVWISLFKWTNVWPIIPSEWIPFPGEKWAISTSHFTPSGPFAKHTSDASKDRSMFWAPNL